MEDNTKITDTTKGGEVVRKASPSTTVRAYNNAIKKLKELEMIDKKEEEQLKAIGKKVMEKFIGLDMFN